MAIRKYTNGAWAPTGRKYGTETDTVISLPVQIIGDGQPITSCQISGNTVQDGTPTPSDPVDVVGCGVRTGNLWNEEGFSAIAITSTHEHTDTNTYGTTLSTTIGKETIITQSEYPTGTVGYQNGFFFIDVDFSKYEIGDKVTLSFDYICNEVHSIEGQILTTLYAGKNSNNIPVVLSSGKWSVSGRLTAFITVIADMNPYVEVRLCGNSITVKNIMLNTGSTALPYEPYGFKLPLTVNGTEYPIYLGQVETTRRIYKMRLVNPLSSTQASDGYRLVFTVSSHPAPPYQSGGGVCNIASWNTNYNRIGFVVTGNDAFITQNISEWATKERATQWLEENEIYIWYVLAKPETAVVNEPLHKIGDYADTVSATNIPTTGTAEQFDIQTTLKPSEVQLTYHGWHEHADTKYTE